MPNPLPSHSGLPLLTTPQRSFRVCHATRQAARRLILSCLVGRATSPEQFPLGQTGTGMTCWSRLQLDPSNPKKKDENENEKDTLGNLLATSRPTDNHPDVLWQPGPCILSQTMKRKPVTARSHGPKPYGIQAVSLVPPGFQRARNFFFLGLCFRMDTFRETSSQDLIYPRSRMDANGANSPRHTLRCSPHRPLLWPLPSLAPKNPLLRPSPPFHLFLFHLFPCVEELT